MSEPPSAQAIPEEAPLRQGSVSMRRLAPMLLTALFLLAIFVLPYRVPLLNPIASTSWEFGFSNFAARVLVALLLLSLLACQLFLDRRGSESSALDRALLDPAQPGSRWALLIAMGVSQALVCALLIGWYRFLPFARTGEMAYFIQRLAVMVLGRLPYRDFGFAYGPSMLWVPIFIYRVTHARLSIDDAYLITLLFHYVLGFSLIAYAVSHLNQESARARVVIYALMAIPFFNLTMGLNYAPLRFAIAPASILAIRHLYRVYRAQTSPALGGCALALAAFVLPVVNCAISPEMGLAVIASLCVYFLWFLLGPERRSALLVLPVAAGTWAVAAWFPSGYFDSILFFSKGGLDFPLLPTVHVLSMFAAAIWILPRLGVVAFRERSSAASFSAAWAVLLGFLLLPATGRCDAGHILFNSFGLFLLALSGATFLRARWCVLLLGGYFIIFPLFGQIAFWNDYRPSFQRVLIARRQLAERSFVSDNAPSAPGSPAPPVHFSKLLPIDPWQEALPQVPIGLPLGADEVTERYLILTHRSLSEYYIAPHADLYAPAQLERKFEDLRKMTYIYVPRYYFKMINGEDPAVHAREDNAFLSGLLLFPVDLTPVNALFNPEAAIVKRIAREYVIFKQCPSGLLMKRRE